MCGLYGVGETFGAILEDIDPGSLKNVYIKLSEWEGRMSQERHSLNRGRDGETGVLTPRQGSIDSWRERSPEPDRLLQSQRNHAAGSYWSLPTAFPLNQSEGN